MAGKREFRYWTDGDGQVLRRDEFLGASTSNGGELINAHANRSHAYYYLGGHRIGNVGNDGTERVDYAQELAQVKPEQTKAEDYYKRFTPSASADFDENYMPINSGYPGSAPGSVTVRPGDTLRSIATYLWGDASLWYMLADANGLSGDDALVAGTVLRVPNKVTNFHNTSETFKPYDAGKAIGDTSPTLPEPPPPPGKGGCGGIGTILAVVVAVVATVYTAGLAASALSSSFISTMAAGASTMSIGSAAIAGGSLAAAAIGGAVGAAAGQLTAMATGVQDKFSWTGVALGAVGAGVAAGLGEASGLATKLASLGESGAQIALGGIRSAVTQGIGVVTGLQSGFDWKGVAASAIASGVAYGMGHTPFGSKGAVGAITRGVSAGTASALVRGDSVGKSFGAIAMDVIGSTIGNAVAQKVAALNDAAPQIASSSPHASYSPWDYALAAGGSESLAMGEAARQAAKSYKAHPIFQLPPIEVWSDKNSEVGVTAHVDVDPNVEWDLSAPINGTYLGAGQSAIEALHYSSAQNREAAPRDSIRVLEKPVGSQGHGTPSVDNAVSRYDRFSTWAHGGLSAAGMVPVLGAIPDVGDLILTAAEIPYGKSTWGDLGFAALGVGATLVPVGGDQVAGGLKIANRAARMAGDTTGEIKLGANGVGTESPVLRQAYVNEVRGLEDVGLNARVAGATPEDTARMLSQVRRDLGVQYKNLTPPDELAQIYSRNLEKYGDKLGPTIDYMRSVQGKTWEQIIEKAATPGGKGLGY